MKKKILLIILLAFFSTNIFAKQHVYKYHYVSEGYFFPTKHPDILSELENTLKKLIDKGYRIVSFTLKAEGTYCNDGFVIVYEDKE